VLERVANCKAWQNPESAVRRILFWYRFPFRSTRPTIILCASERQEGQLHAQILAAARVLTDTHNFSVVIDTSDHAVPLVLTEREHNIELEPMNDEMMKKLSGYEGLFKFLEQEGLEQVVLAICGGCPGKLDGLQVKLKQEGSKDEQKKTAVRNFVVDAIERALSARKALLVKSEKEKELSAELEVFAGKETKEIKLQESDFFAKFQITGADGTRRNIDIKGVFRVKIDKDASTPILVPANGAMAVVLRAGPHFDLDENQTTEKNFDLIVKALSKPVLSHVKSE